MKALKLFIGLLAGSGVYCYLMWYQTLGINALVFAVLLISAVFWYKKELRKNGIVRFLALSFFLSALAVAMNGITFSQVIYYLVMLTFLGFVQAPELRSVVFGWLSMFLNFFASIKVNFQMTLDAASSLFARKRNIKFRDVRALFSRIVIVSILSLTFFCIFIAANQPFREFFLQLVNPVEDFFSFMWKYFRPFNALHYAFTFYFLALFFLVFQKNAASREEALYGDNLVRKHYANRPLFPKSRLTMGLKDEYKTAKLSILVINILLFTVNLSDIFSVWLGIVPEKMSDLAEFVHTGTYMLIVSALLSIGILLFFFRRNLNFYPANRQLRIISTVWICQNMFMLLSVALRNMHYISQCGLTYKRIGVFIFLIITGLALLFLYQKISRQKTFYFHARACGWGVFCTLLAASFVNWDLVIARNNVSFGVKQDYDYIHRELSPQSFVFLPKEVMDEHLKREISDYISSIETRDWQSFTFWEYWAANQMKIK